jgi:hypothetical protein
MLDVEALRSSDELRATTGERAGTRYPIARFRERSTPGGDVERVERPTANTPERETSPELIEAIYGSTDAALSQ